jgi:Ca2+-binding EF-hand superfamily protein
MGQQASSQSDEQLKALQESTKLGENQVRAAVKGFKKSSSSKTTTHVTKAEFIETLRVGGVGSKLLANQFWKIVAKKAEKDDLKKAEKDDVAAKRGEKEEITVEDFVCALALVGRGDSSQRLNLTFDLLDVDEDGFISKQEMTDVLKEVLFVCFCLFCLVVF